VAEKYLGRYKTILYYSLPYILGHIILTFVITLAELCISPVGLEFAYRQAAPGTKSVVTAAFSERYNIVGSGDQRV
jgi:dipeptide/tripeptide permease